MRKPTPRQFALLLGSFLLAGAAVFFAISFWPVESSALKAHATGSATPRPRPIRAKAASMEIEDALSMALEAANPYQTEGFTVREDYWGGDLPVKQPKAIVHQLYKGNEYWCWLGTDQIDTTLSVHVYDSTGRLAEAESWQKPHEAAARILPKTTGSYYLIVEIEKSTTDRAYWALAYGFR